MTSFEDDKYILRHLIRSDPTGHVPRTIIQDAIVHRDLDILDFLLDEISPGIANLNYPPAVPTSLLNNRPLYKACSVGDLEMIKILIKHNAVIHPTPPHENEVVVAFHNTHFNVVEYLLQSYPGEALYESLLNQARCGNLLIGPEEVAFLNKLSYNPRQIYMGGV